MIDGNKWITDLKKAVLAEKAQQGRFQTLIDAQEDHPDSKNAKAIAEWKQHISNFAFNIKEYEAKITAMQQRLDLIKKIDAAPFPSSQYDSLIKSLKANTAVFSSLSPREVNLPAPKPRANKK